MSCSLWSSAAGGSAIRLYVCVCGCCGKGCKKGLTSCSIVLLVVVIKTGAQNVGGCSRKSCHSSRYYGLHDSVGRRGAGSTAVVLSVCRLFVRVSFPGASNLQTIAIANIHLNTGKPREGSGMRGGINPQRKHQLVETIEELAKHSTKYGIFDHVFFAGRPCAPAFTCLRAHHSRTIICGDFNADADTQPEMLWFYQQDGGNQIDTYAAVHGTFEKRREQEGVRLCVGNCCRGVVLFEKLFTHCRTRSYLVRQEPSYDRLDGGRRPAH